MPVLESLFDNVAGLKSCSFINPIQDGGGGVGAERPPTSFSSVTSANLRINTQNFLTFSFDLFATLV